MIYLNEIDPLDSNIRNWKFHGEIGSGYMYYVLVYRALLDIRVGLYINLFS